MKNPDETQVWCKECVCYLHSIGFNGSEVKEVMCPYGCYKVSRGVIEMRNPPYSYNKFGNKMKSDL